MVLAMQALEAKRKNKTAMVSYNILDAWHSGDRVMHLSLETPTPHPREMWGKRGDLQVLK